MAFNNCGGGDESPVISKEFRTSRPMSLLVSPGRSNFLKKKSKNKLHKHRKSNADRDNLPVEKLELRASTSLQPPNYQIHMQPIRHEHEPESGVVSPCMECNNNSPVQMHQTVAYLGRGRSKSVYAGLLAHSESFQGRLESLLKVQKKPRRRPPPLSLNNKSLTGPGPGVRRISENTASVPCSSHDLITPSSDTGTGAGHSRVRTLDHAEHHPNQYNFDMIDATPTSASIERNIHLPLGADAKQQFNEKGVAATALGQQTPAPFQPSHKDNHLRLNLDTTVDDSHIITINVSGLRFQTLQESLSRYPDSLLGNPLKRAQYFNREQGEYFFDRHRACFESILYIYQSGGRIKRPDAVPMDIFLQEMKFFEMGSDLMDKFWAAEGYEKPVDPPMPAYKLQRRIWKLIEHADSSVAARIIAFLSVFVILVSIVSFCLETVPSLGGSNHNCTPVLYANGTVNHSQPPQCPIRVFFIIECVCIAWFTFEFMTRFLSCPDKCVFIKSFLNIVDVLAIAPFFVNLFLLDDEGGGGGGMQFAVLRVLRLVRVFRIFKLSRHSVGLQILGKTFKASVQEFMLLFFFLCIALVLFASGMYFAEGGGMADEDGEPTKFSSIPASFWYVLVTMTTVGYGDMYPIKTAGKLVGSCCALIGVLTLALPVPIIVGNFKFFYRQETRLAQMREQEDYKDDDGDSVSSD